MQRAFPIRTAPTRKNSHANASACRRRCSGRGGLVRSCISGRAASATRMRATPHMCSTSWRWSNWPPRVSGHLILRLPQVAGKTPNPHTLLNFLYARIARSESFNVWSGARRNIIDIADVLAVARQLLAEGAARNTMLNIANTVDYSIFDIVGVMERALGKRAVYSILERGSGYLIDIAAILPALEKAEVKFEGDYLENVIRKYYGNPARTL